MDDSQDSCDLLSFILSEVGYEVVSVQSMAEGLQNAQLEDFNLYLIDLSFSDGNGFDLIEKIREFDTSTPIVVCSGDVRRSTQEEAARLGVRAFITKPIDPASVAGAIAEILGDELQFNS